MRSAILPAACAIALVSCRPPTPPDEENPPDGKDPPDEARQVESTPSGVPFAGTGRRANSGPAARALEKRTYALAPAGDILHAGTTAGIVAWDVSDPESPVTTGRIVLPGSVAGLTPIGEDLLAAATGPTGVALVSWKPGHEEPYGLIADGTWAARGGCHSASKVAHAGEGRIFVACGSAGIAEASVSDPRSPEIVRLASVDGHVRDVVVIESDGPAVLVAAAADDAGLVIVEFAPGAGARVVGHLDTDGEARGLAISGRLVWIADGPGGLVAVDVSDPAHPVRAGAWAPEMTDMVRGALIDGDTAYAFCGESGLGILDVSDPSQPVERGSHDPGRAFNRATVVGKILYSANDDAGLLVLDVSDPGAPRKLFP